MASNMSEKNEELSQMLDEIRAIKETNEKLQTKANVCYFCFFLCAFIFFLYRFFFRLCVQFFCDTQRAIVEIFVGCQLAFFAFFFKFFCKGSEGITMR